MITDEGLLEAVKSNDPDEFLNRKVARLWKRTARVVAHLEAELAEE